jgi:hypothetical protein
LPAKGFAQPARFGAMPPETSRPAPPRARGEIGGELREIGGAVLEPGVHRAHDDAIGQRGETEIEGGEQVPVRHAGDCIRISA